MSLHPLIGPASWSDDRNRCRCFWGLQEMSRRKKKVNSGETDEVKMNDSFKIGNLTTVLLINSYFSIYQSIIWVIQQIPCEFISKKKKKSIHTPNFKHYFSFLESVNLAGCLHSSDYDGVAITTVCPRKTTDDYKRARIHGKPVPFVFDLTLWLNALSLVLTHQQQHNNLLFNAEPSRLWSFAGTWPA